MMESFVDGNSVRLLRDGPEAFPAMLREIERATRTVRLEMYWFSDDPVGSAFRDALVRAAKRGVEVFVLFDSFGSLGTPSEFFEPLRQVSSVAEYNPVTPWRRRFRLSRLTRRDHRKVLIVDDLVAFTGGLNLVRHWQPSDDSQLPWRDDAIRVEGPAAIELARCFLANWSEVCGAALRVIAYESFPSPASNATARVAVLPQAYVRQRRSTFLAYLRRVQTAKERVWIANAYFVPNRRMTRALQRAARRGVDVRIIVPAVSDVEIVRHASRAVWDRLLRAGARIFSWQPSILHSKTAVVDGEWATIGSFNLDYLSARRNLELNVSVLDRDFARQVEQSFAMDWEHCIEVDYHDFVFRSLGERVLERVAYWFRVWL